MSKYIILKALNLSEKEQSILKVLEDHKMARRAAAIARLAGMPRTSTIHTLNKLVKWKLAKVVHCGTHDRWMYNRTLKP